MISAGGRRGRAQMPRRGVVVFVVAAVLTCAAFSTAPQRAVAITWPTSFNAIGACGENEPFGDKTPSTLDLVGSAGANAAFIQLDSTYLYLRQRVATNPSHPSGFTSDNWVVLLQVATGNPFQYQYLIALDGVSEEVQLWRNDVASNISFNPIFNDPAESKIFSDTTANLARIVPAGTSIGGNPNYFVDWAIPLSVLAANGIDPSLALYWFATSANANNYNKDTLNCPFTPTAALSLSKAVAPSTIGVGPNSLTYSISVVNSGTYLARGVVVSDNDFPSWITINNVTSTTGSVTFTASSFEVRLPDFAIGASETITVTATANATAPTSFSNTVTAFATNAAQVSATALLSVTAPTVTPTATQPPTATGTSIPTVTPTPTPTSACVNPSGTPTVCDDGNLCNGTEVCDHVLGCRPGTPLLCDDGNVCNGTETCNPQMGCVPGTPLTCGNGNPCDGTENCDPNLGCQFGPPPACDDGDICNGLETCVPFVGCVPGTPLDCSDADPCSVDTCDPIDGCMNNKPGVTCRLAGRSSLWLRNRSLDRKDKFIWRWGRGDTPLNELGDPINGTTGFAVCLYDQTAPANAPTFIAMSYFPPSGTCVRGKPCWQKIYGGAAVKGFKYKDRPNGGHLRLVLNEGMKKRARMRMIGQGGSLSLPPANSSNIMSQNTQVMVQLVSSDGLCWEGRFAPPAKKNLGDEFVDRCSRGRAGKCDGTP
jgi:hypothetical protein